MQNKAGLLNDAQVDLCYGPVGRAEVFDRARVGEVRFADTRLEASQTAKDSVVLLKHDDELCAGRVQAVLSHSAPGSPSGQEHTLNLSYVQWYPFVPSDQDPMDAALGCPIFGRTLIENDPTGNMCLVEQLLPCRLACLPYKQHGSRNQVVILSRFSSFMEAMPD